jgi:hypothetical protein
MFETLSKVTSLQFSKLAVDRINQRSFTQIEISIIVEFGEQFSDGLLMTRRAQEKARKVFKRSGNFKFLQCVDHLQNAVLIHSEGYAVTLYRADKKHFDRFFKFQAKAA